MAYATVAALKSDLTRHGTTPMPIDSTLQACLDDAKDLIDGFCHRDFDDHPDDIVTCEGKGLESLLLPVSPLRSVSAVSVDGVALTAGELADLTVLSYGVMRGVLFPAGSKLEVTCTWGYEEPPAKIVRACVTLASRIYRHGAVREKIAQGLRSQSVEGVSLSVDAIDMDRDIAQMLKPYVKRRSAA